MFQEGLDGFKGGLSAEDYIRITKTSRATATRDLQNLVAKDALTKPESCGIRGIPSISPNATRPGRKRSRGEEKIAEWS
jgi:hypothetical protein